MTKEGQMVEGTVSPYLLLISLEREYKSEADNPGSR
jgi:hypothetical protein